MNKAFRLESIIFICLCSFYPLLSTAKPPQIYPHTEERFRLLPPYCKARLEPENKQEEEKWKRILGHDFVHIHHFCASLNGYNYIQSQYRFPKNKGEEGDKRTLIKAVFGNINYVEERADPAFILLPEIFLLKAKMFAYIGDNGNAIKYFQKAISANRKYTKTYLALADYYIQIGLADEAVETLKNGLKYKPNSKALKRKLEKLSQ